jgi:hypothetical protein
MCLFDTRAQTTITLTLALLSIAVFGAACLIHGWRGALVAILIGTAASVMAIPFVALLIWFGIWLSKRP